MSVVLLAVAALVVVGTVAAAWRRERRRRRDLERRSSAFRSALVLLGDALARTEDPAPVVAVVLDTVRALTGADMVVFWRDFGAFLVARAERGAPDVVDERLQAGEGLAGWVAAQRQPSRWPPGAVRPATAEPAARAAMAVPVSAGGRLHGVVSVYRWRSEQFGADDLADAAEICRQAGAVLDAGMLHEEAKRLSLTDGLTGLWNRRQFELRIGQEIERGARFDEEFSVVLVDLDDFKAVNDTHGHAAGDTVLVEASRRLVHHAREVDLVARYGGEEFVLVLPRTDLDGGLQAAERLRASLAEAPVVLDDGRLPVTLSAGVATFPRHGTGVAHLVAAADAALYAAKAAGKNCVRPALEAAVDPTPDVGASP